LETLEDEFLSDAIHQKYEDKVALCTSLRTDYIRRRFIKRTYSNASALTRRCRGTGVVVQVAAKQRKSQLIYIVAKTSFLRRTQFHSCHHAIIKRLSAQILRHKNATSSATKQRSYTGASVLICILQQYAAHRFTGVYTGIFEMTR
jgi:hypothetical protein